MITAEPSVARKARGGFYTPEPIARYLVEWAIRPGVQRVLEPSAGDGAFLEAAARRIAAVSPAAELVAVELMSSEAEIGRARAANAGVEPSMIIGDFFSLDARDIGFVDAVIGNPPWIRYHAFGGEQRAAGQRRAAQMGVTVSSLASSWAPYLVHAASFLSPAGRLAIVVPGELLQVDYAAEIRRFLSRRFRSVRLIGFEGHVFGEAQVDALLLLASQDGPHGVHLDRVESVADIADRMPTAVGSSDRWARGVAGPAADLLGELEASGRMLRLGSLGRVDIGIVTGFNDFFVVSEHEASAFELPRDHLRPILTRSVQLADGVVSPGHMDGWRSAGHKVWLLSLGRGEPNGASRYLAEGERLGAPKRYKCRMRSPWYAVPIKAPPDLFLGYMAHEMPRLAWNEARAHSTNLIHGVYLTVPNHGPSIASAWTNPATALSAELEGRMYGGGVLKLETKEAEQVLVPRPGLELTLTDAERASLTSALTTRRRQRLTRGSRRSRRSSA